MANLHQRNLSVENRSSVYEINTDVHLVLGAIRGAIYDFNSGKVYSVNKKAVEILLGNIEDSNYEDKLRGMGLLWEEKRKVSPLAEKEREPNQNVNFAWLEIEDRCNEKCIHCYGSFGFEPARYEDRITHKKWKEIIEELYSDNVRKIQFIGGEPFKYKDISTGKDVFDLIKHAIDIGFDPSHIEVFTNGTMLTEGRVAKIKESGVHVAVSIYSSEQKVHDTITRVPGSHRLTMKGINRLVRCGVPFRIGFVVMRENEHTVDKTKEVLSKLGIHKIEPDTIRPTGSGSHDSLRPSSDFIKKCGLQMEPDFIANKEKFARNKIQNPCLNGKIAITVNGTILPCVFARNQSFGNIKYKSLKEIMQNDEIKRIWGVTLDHVLICKDCEYRYGCFDCRPLASDTNGGVRFYDSPPARCTYNPYTEEWGKGVWKIVGEKPNYVFFETGDV